MADNKGVFVCCVRIRSPKAILVVLHHALRASLQWNSLQAHLLRSLLQNRPRIWPPPLLRCAASLLRVLLDGHRLDMSDIDLHCALLELYVCCRYRTPQAWLRGDTVVS